jgi:L-aminopeptidase/D-esterase-like protein
VIAGARSAPDSLDLLNIRQALLRGQVARAILPGTNTTIGVVATNAALTKAQAKRLASSGHDGLARSINPVHTVSDGDTLFALATGTATASVSTMTLCHMVAEVTARAVVNAVLAARSLRIEDGASAATTTLTTGGYWPGLADKV